MNKKNLNKMKKGDFNMHRKLRENNPSIFRLQNSVISSIEFCLICLDTSASKLFLLNQNSNLARAYTNITGHDVSVIRDDINTEPKLCSECAQRLTNCVTFKDKTLRAHSILIQLLQKDKVITSQSLNSVDRLENLLISNLGKLSYEPDHCDLFVIEEDNNTEMENIICYPEVNIENLKSDDKTMSYFENSEIDSEINELDNIHNDVQAINNDINEDHKFNDSDNKNIIIKNSSQVRNNDKKYNDVIINPVTSNNCKVENDEGDVFIICGSDDEMEYLDYDIDHDIDGGIKNDVSDDVDDINDDIDIDEDDNNDKLANDSHNSDRLIIKRKLCNNSENRVSLNNLVFVKYTKPITDNDLDHGTDELLNRNYSNDKLSKKLKIDNNSENRVSLDNFIFVKATRPIIQHKDFIPRTNNANQNLNRVYGTDNHNRDKTMVEEINDDSYECKNGSNVINFGKSDKKRFPLALTPKKSGQGLRRKRDKKPQTYVSRPKTQDCTEEDLKSFTRTRLTHEEQITDLQKRKDSVLYKRSEYKCEICFKGSWQLSTYNRHMDRHTDKYGKFVCAICGIHCKTRDSLYTHTTANHSERYSCKLCKFTVNAKVQALIHARWHSGKSYACAHCGAVFSKPSSYFSHVRLKHPSDCVCPLCGFSFVSTKGVGLHIRLRHPFEDKHNLSGPSCEKCNIRFASETAYQQHMAVSPKHAISGKLKRNQARNSVHKSKATSYTRRVQRPTVAANVLCELCGRKFHAAAKLRDHMHVHTGQKMYKCDICPKRFASKFLSKAHMLTCHGDNPLRFPCGVCHKEFKYDSNRRRHMLSHQDTRPLYKCDICDKTFTTLSGRDQHVSHVHFSLPRPKRNRRDRQPNTRRHSAATSDSQDLNTEETNANNSD
ncbi:uncharacterized protein [Maniola hyperantus]|uniref:uncharacterized protein isoform X2 n=1 Tax=Aphantopus hyperantus TaxID=2795564 RepID=UPI00213246F4